MNIEGLRQKLLAAARAERPDDRVPYAFEKRVMALILGRPTPDHWANWVAPLWRAAVSCVAVMVFIGAVSFYTASQDNNAGINPDALAQDFDQTLYAAVNPSVED